MDTPHSARWRQLARYWGIAHACHCEKQRDEAAECARHGDFARAQLLDEDSEWHRLATRAHARSLVRGTR